MLYDLQLADQVSARIGIPMLSQHGRSVDLKGLFWY